MFEFNPEQNQDKYTYVLLEGTEENIEKTLDEFKANGIEYKEIDNE